MASAGKEGGAYFLHLDRRSRPERHPAPLLSEGDGSGNAGDDISPNPDVVTALSYENAA